MLVKLDSFEHIRWYSSTKADKCCSCYLSEQVVYFQKQINVLFWVIIYSYLQRLFKVGVIKAICPIHRKTTVLDSLFNQPVSWYFFNKRLRRVLVKKTIFAKLLDTSDSVFMEHICNYNIKFSVNYPKWLFEPFERKCIYVKLKLRECEKLFSSFSSDSVKFVLKHG